MAHPHVSGRYGKDYTSWRAFIDASGNRLALSTGSVADMVRTMASRGPRQGVKVAVVTVEAAGRGSAKACADAVKASLERHGHKAVRSVSVRGDLHEVQRALREAIEDRDVQAIVIVGGTGLSRSDVTLEAVAPFEEKSLSGFGEGVRAISDEAIGPDRILVRCTAFVSEAKVVCCLPDSDKVAALAAERLIGPTLSKAVREANA